MTRQVKHWNRYELKYLVAHERVDELVTALGPYVHADPNCPDERGYPIYSVYYDSGGLGFFWEKIEGLKFRRKVRFRRYGESREVYLEIKQRVDRTLQKRRVHWPLSRVREVFTPDGLDETRAPEKPDAVEAEILFLWRHHELEPTMGISYRRRAFFASNESDLRITFDSRVQYHAAEPDVARRPDAGKYVVDPDYSVMEVKYSHSVPLWLCKTVSEFGLGVVRLSKYCSAVDREYFEGRLT